MHKKHGFTIIELLVVVAVMSVLASAVIASLDSIRDRGRAAEVANEMAAIRDAWYRWQADTGADFPHEYIHTSGGIDYYPHDPSDTDTCHDDPHVTLTDLATNKLGLSGWNGPYINVDSSMVKGPYGHHYTYDNTGDTYKNLESINGSRWAGVGVQLQWCESQGDDRYDYIALAPYIDEVFDDGDGREIGEFRWENGANTSLSLLIATSGSDVEVYDP